MMMACLASLPIRCLVACCLAAAATSTSAAEPKPNVLFIAVDDLRPEPTAVGRNRAVTPNIDRIAARGTTFDRAYCQQALCSPSRSSLMTGRRPDATRVWDLEAHFRSALPDAVTIGQHFQANGYFVQGMGKIFHNGFDDPPTWSIPWRNAPAPTYATPDAIALASDPRNRDAAGKPRGPATEAADVPDDTYLDGKISRLAAEALADLKRRGEPFFLAVGMIRPHLPFVAPKRYWDLYDPATIPAPAFQELPHGAPGFVGNGSGELRTYADIPKEGPIPEEIARRLRHGYHAAISYMDAQVGVMLDALDREGLTDNTVIVLWGDHGWQLGEHGLWAKHTNFEAAVRAPLVISVPGQRGAGHRSLALAEFVDIYPTLADVCGLPVPTGLDGVSLRPVLDDASARVREVAISQYPRKTKDRRLMGYSIRDDRWRLTLWRDREDGTLVASELYDEEGDPDETVNLADRSEHSDLVRRLSTHIPPLVGAASQRQ
jgi:iduronate 2-sulfatase